MSSPRDQDLRLKLTKPTHAVLSQLASLDRLTLQAYVERLIADHCNGKLEVARQLVAAVEDLAADAPVRRSQMLYFIQRADGPIKIGVAAHVPGRLKHLQTGSSDLLTLLWSAPQDEHLNERAVHRRFRHLRLEGEWFRAETELLDFIAARGAK